MSSNARKVEIITEPSLHPWTVMVSYLKTEAKFFFTEIEADSEAEAIQIVRDLGYCFPKDTFQLVAKRVPIIGKLEYNNHVSSNQPVSRPETNARVAVGAQTARK